MKKTILLLAGAITTICACKEEQPESTAAMSADINGMVLSVDRNGGGVNMSFTANEVTITYIHQLDAKTTKYEVQRGTYTYTPPKMTLTLPDGEYVGTLVYRSEGAIPYAVMELRQFPAERLIRGGTTSTPTSPIEVPTILSVVRLTDTIIKFLPRITTDTSYRVDTLYIGNVQPPRIYRIDTVMVTRKDTFKMDGQVVRFPDTTLTYTKTKVSWTQVDGAQRYYVFRSTKRWSSGSSDVKQLLFVEDSTSTATTAQKYVDASITTIVDKAPNYDSKSNAGNNYYWIYAWKENATDTLTSNLSAAGYLNFEKPTQK